MVNMMNMENMQNLHQKMNKLIYFALLGSLQEKLARNWRRWSMFTSD